MKKILFLEAVSAIFCIIAVIIAFAVLSGSTGLSTQKYLIVATISIGVSVSTSILAGRISKRR